MSDPEQNRSTDPAAPGSLNRLVLPPLRRWKLRLEIGADTIEDMRSALKGVQLDLFVNHCNSATGGGDVAGWHFDLEEQAPDMTHDKYVARLEEYLDSLRRRNDQAHRPPTTDP